MLRLYLWPHRIAYLGMSPDNHLHRHHAAQLCLSLDNALQIHQTSGRDSLETQGVFIPPDYPHQIDAADARILAIYLEPESDEYQPLIQPLRMGKDTALVPISVSAQGLATLHSLFEMGAGAERAWSTCQHALGLGASTTRHAERDPRIEKVIRIIRSEPSRSQSIDQLADTVHLSASRLTHLFREQVGVPVRRFRVWSRIRQAIQITHGGATLTEAAHLAGFSDAAHMSNTFRQTFGFAPSALFATRIPKDVHIIE